MTRNNPTNKTTAAPKRLARGFVQTGGLLGNRIRKATEKRGFAEARLLTHWDEIVGPDIAAMAQPVKVSYGREGLGATLSVLTKGAYAPQMQMQLPKIKDKVNACYGYAAIARIRLTQTAETGFAEAAPAFPAAPAPQKPNPQKEAAVDHAVEAVESDTLRSALAALGRNILSRTSNRTS